MTLSLSLAPSGASDPLAAVLDGLDGDRDLLREAACTGAVFNFTGGRNIHAVRGRIYNDIRDVPGAVFERASPAYVEDGEQSRMAPADTPRITAQGLLIEPERTNLARGSALTHDPAFWPVSTHQNGLTLTRVGAGVEYGLPYVDVRFEGQATASFVDTAYVSAQSRTLAEAGETYTASLYARQIGGSDIGVEGLRIGVIEENSDQAFTGGSYSPQTQLTERQRLVAVREVISGVQVRCAPILSLEPGAAVDVTYRLSSLQLEVGAEASSALPSGASPRTSADDNLTIHPLEPLGFPPATTAPFTVFSVWSYITNRTAFPWVWSLNDGAADSLGVQIDAASGQVWDAVTTGGLNQGHLGGVAITPLMRMATHYAPNDRVLFVNGVETGVDTIIDLPHPTRLHLGGNDSVGARWHIKLWGLIPRGASTSELGHLSG